MSITEMTAKRPRSNANDQTTFGSLCKRVLLPLLLVAGCAQHPPGIEALGDFDAERYLGGWYEIARLDNRFEEGLDNVTANYTKRDDGGINVRNRGYDREEGSWQEVRGRAYFVDGPDKGALKVSFFRPFYGGYNVIALDRENYQWAMVCGPDRSYLWILSRTPKLDPAVLDSLRTQAENLGFPVEELNVIRHDQPPPAKS